MALPVLAERMVQGDRSDGRHGHALPVDGVEARMLSLTTMNLSGNLPSRSNYRHRLAIRRLPRVEGGCCRAR